MFGYVTLRPGAVSEEDFKRYRAFYCGLCNTLNTGFGITSSLTLSYDITFVIMLLNSLYEGGEGKAQIRCLPHPLHLHSAIICEATKYCAAMNIALSYHKLLDDVRDEKSVKARAALLFLNGAYKKARSMYPKKCEAIERGLSRLCELERENCKDIDALINSFGNIMADIISYHDDDMFAPALKSLGLGLGGFVYMMDAYEDFDKDQREGCFNPLTELHQRNDYEDKVNDIMTMLMGECAEAFEYLPLQLDVGILRSVIYDGVWEKYDIIRTRKKRNRQTFSML